MDCAEGEGEFGQRAEAGGEGGGEGEEAVGFLGLVLWLVLRVLGGGLLG